MESCHPKGFKVRNERGSKGINLQRDRPIEISIEGFKLDGKYITLVIVSSLPMVKPKVNSIIIT